MDAELELKLAQIRSDISDIKSALTDHFGTTFNAKQAREILGLSRYKFHALFDKYDLQGQGIPNPKNVGVSKVYTMEMIKKMREAIRGCLD